MGSISSDNLLPSSVQNELRNARKMIRNMNPTTREILEQCLEKLKKNFSTETQNLFPNNVFQFLECSERKLEYRLSKKIDQTAMEILTPENKRTFQDTQTILSKEVIPTKMVKDDLNFSDEEIKKILGDSDQVMVYGFGHAYYTKIGEILKKKTNILHKVFDWSLGNPTADLECKTTSEGRIIEQLPFEKNPKAGVRDSDARNTARICKSGITNLVFENWKRKKAGLPIIPLLFCLESSETSVAWKTTPHTLSTKEDSLNKLITHAELRRIYKLCKEFENEQDPVLQELAQVAKQTLKLVRIERDLITQENHFVVVDPAWGQREWDHEWTNRLQTNPQVREENRREKKIKWREDLAARAKEYNPNSQIPSDTSQEFKALEKEYYNLVGSFVENPNEGINLDQINNYSEFPNVTLFKQWIKKKSDYQKYKDIVEDVNFEKLYQRVIKIML